jgi:hypothetical protein
VFALYLSLGEHEVRPCKFGILSGMEMRVYSGTPCGMVYLNMLHSRFRGNEGEAHE